MPLRYLWTAPTLRNHHKGKLIMTTVLCIDDEAEITALIVEESAETGSTTLEASNGREGLELLISKWPDIVISDITMPEMDGHQLLAEIQINYPELANVPFIFL